MLPSRSSNLKFYSFRKSMFPLWRRENPSRLWTTECVWVHALQSNSRTRSITKSAHPRTCSCTRTPWSKGREDIRAMWAVSTSSAALSIFPQERQGCKPYIKDRQVYRMSYQALFFLWCRIRVVCFLPMFQCSNYMSFVSCKGYASRLEVQHEGSHAECTQNGDTQQLWISLEAQ